MKIIIVVCVVFVVALAAAALNVVEEEPVEPLIVGTEDTPIEETNEINGVGTLESLTSIDERLECQITYRPNPDTEPITGSYFIDDTRVRGDFLLIDESLGEIVSSYIVDGDTLYAWSLIDGEKYGVQVTGDFSASPANLPIPAEESVRYQCETWTQYDGSIFIPPGDVLFRDGSEVQAEYGTIYE